ncbi:sensor histidine kinase [Bailinhaonella thermotolerans]|uniref:histidine kinase n=2 Tax=Bailinhaonella thermotolerans TaxID=1070861 RepID=A0A3A4B5T8_9ACTN|nr:sensor histidine kinase [Bailinhaonella thermotolerans]
MAMLLFLAVLLTALTATVVGGVGLVALPHLLVWLRRWAEWHRGRAAALLGVTVAARETRLPRGIRAQWRNIAGDREIMRDLRWAVLHVATGLPAGLAALVILGLVVNAVVQTPVWWLFPADEPLRFLVYVPVTNWTNAILLGLAQAVIGAALVGWTFPPMARGLARHCLRALEPTHEERLAERVGELAESRAEVLDAHAAELRRIERDLHDGAQARLVSIAMLLGVARETLPDQDGPLARLLRQAHEGAEEAMSELRGVIRTMYPPILADRGLPGAVAAVAARVPVPVEVTLGDLGRVPAAVEAAAYFIVAEAITNVSRHSGAARAAVRLARRDGTLVVEVTDDGRGGIDESRGTGVAGIRKRAAALDGTVLVDSPAGGPTTLTVELPCAS